MSNVGETHTATGLISSAGVVYSAKCDVRSPVAWSRMIDPNSNPNFDVRHTHTLTPAHVHTMQLIVDVFFQL